MDIFSICAEKYLNQGFSESTIVGFEELGAEELFAHDITLPLLVIILNKLAMDNNTPIPFPAEKLVKKSNFGFFSLIVDDSFFYGEIEIPVSYIDDAISIIGKLINNGSDKISYEFLLGDFFMNASETNYVTVEDYKGVDIIGYLNKIILSKYHYNFSMH